MLILLKDYRMNPSPIFFFKFSLLSGSRGNSGVPVSLRLWALVVLQLLWQNPLPWSSFPPAIHPLLLTNSQREKQEGAGGTRRVVSCSNHSRASPSLFQLIYFAFMNLRDWLLLSKRLTFHSSEGVWNVTGEREEK